ncbi:LacI family DNA-binding transcriptional regulator [Streptomyces sp. NPDC050315]|uniref:LacI family DNA-binding transcriptional regulator n=1 Tax=Streptomyces sp. NPDC050315 TaxID=3155039 RepID=UPI00343B26DC
MSGVAGGRRVTSTDVAREAGVSRSTVSIVLNDAPHHSIPESTRRRVQEAASRLGYAPSAAARTLRSGRSDIVLGLLPDWPIGPTNTQMLRELSAAFARHRLTFVVHTHVPDARPLSEVWKAITPAAVLALDEFAADDAEAMRAAGIEATVMLQGPTRNWQRVTVIPAHPVGSMQARHLAGKHRQLGYAYPDDERLSSFAEPRLQGVRQTCAELGLPAPDVRPVPLDAEGAAEVIRAWRSADVPVTGICAYNDEVALALLAGLRHLGLESPRDLAVVGVDDIPSAALAAPPLTTVRRDVVALADRIARGVVGALAGRPLPGTIEPDVLRLVTRESS